MLNQALRLVRVYHDLSQTQLSYDLGISNSFLSEIESGRKQPSLDLLARYSAKFDIPVSSLLFFSEQLDNTKPTDKIRMSLAKKVVSLLEWVAAKDSKKVVEA